MLVIVCTLVSIKAFLFFPVKWMVEIEKFDSDDDRKGPSSSIGDTVEAITRLIDQCSPLAYLHHYSYMKF